MSTAPSVAVLSGEGLDALNTPGRGTAFETLLTDLRAQGFRAIADFLKTDQESLRSLIEAELENPSTIAGKGVTRTLGFPEGLSTRLGEIEAMILAEKVSKLVDVSELSAAAVEGPESFSAAISGKIRWSTLLDGYGFGEAAPPPITKLFTEAVRDALVDAASSNPSLTSLLEGTLETSFFSRRTVYDFRAIALARIEQGLQAFAERGQEDGEVGRVAELNSENIVTSNAPTPAQSLDGRDGESAEHLSHDADGRFKSLVSILQTFVSGEGEAGQLKSFLGAFPELSTQLLAANEEIKRSILGRGDIGCRNPEAVALILEEVLSSPSAGRCCLSLLKMTTPEAFPFLGARTISFLRQELGFDNITNLRAVDATVRSAVQKLAGFAGCLEVSTKLVNRVLQFPQGLFERMKNESNGQVISQINLEGVALLVGRFNQILRDSSEHPGTNLTTWRQSNEYQELPYWYRTIMKTRVRKTTQVRASLKQP